MIDLTKQNISKPLLIKHCVSIHRKQSLCAVCTTPQTMVMRSGINRFRCCDTRVHADMEDSVSELRTDQADMRNANAVMLRYRQLRCCVLEIWFVSISI